VRAQDDVVDRGDRQQQAREQEHDGLGPTHGARFSAAAAGGIVPAEQLPAGRA